MPEITERLTTALADRYKIERELGVGGMATVYLAEDLKHDRRVAVKVLRPELAAVIGADRFIQEIKTTANLQHPHILPLFDSGEADSFLFYVMPYVEGETLGDRLERESQLPVDEAVKIATEIADALQAAHEQGVIHRDIKPANILIATDGTVKLADMGLAKGEHDLTITRDGATVGTPQYISPEQAKDPQNVDVRSDLYSLGATLFHMCTGQPPFRAETMASVLLKVMSDRAPSAAGINPELSDGLNLIIRKLLSKNPAHRYQTPSHLLSDLRRVKSAERPDVDEAELSRAKNQLRAATVMSLESTGSRAEQLGQQMLVFGRPIPVAEQVERIEAVDTDAVKSIADRIFAGRPTLAAIGPTAKLMDYDALVARLVG